MQVVKLRKVGNSATVTLPASVVEALHLREMMRSLLRLLETVLYLLVPLRISRIRGQLTRLLSRVIETRIANWLSR